MGNKLIIGIIVILAIAFSSFLYTGLQSITSTDKVTFCLDVSDYKDEGYVFHHYDDLNCEIVSKSIAIASQTINVRCNNRKQAYFCTQRLGSPWVPNGCDGSRVRCSIKALNYKGGHGDVYIIIENLQDELREKIAQANEAEASIAELDALLEEYHLSLEEKAGAILLMELDLQEKAEIISMITDKADEQAVLISTLELGIADQSVIISNLENTVAENGILINELDISVTQQAVIISELNLALLEKINLVKLIQIEVNTQANIISQLNLNKLIQDI